MLARNMTQGNLLTCLFQFSVPLIMSGLLQQLYNWADAFIVGRVEGELALGAIGATGTISNFCVMVIMGFTLGLSILTARHYGREETAPIKAVLSSFSILLGVVSLAAALACFGWTEEILRLMRTPSELFALARDYVRIIFLGVPFLALYNVYSAVLRGMGDSKAPFFSIVVSAVTNILLDLLLVALFGWGVWGAAIATVAAQGMMVVFIVCYTRKRYPFLRFALDRAAIQTGVLREGGALGVPSALQSGIRSGGSIILQNFMNGFGSATVTAITTAYRVDLLIMLPIINLGAGISTIVAQNLGVGDRQRAQKAFYLGAAIEAAISLVLTVLMMTCGGMFVALFGVSSEVAEIGGQFFRAICWFYLAFGLSTALKGFLDGMGDVAFTSVASIAVLALRILLSYAWAERWGNLVIAYAEAVSWIALVCILFLRFLWKTAGVTKRP